MRIENYLGFPTGITGSELAERASPSPHRSLAVMFVHEYLKDM
jgi:thioredoxin reductase